MKKAEGLPWHTLDERGKVLCSNCAIVDCILQVQSLQLVVLTHTFINGILSLKKMMMIYSTIFIFMSLLITFCIYSMVYIGEVNVCVLQK